MKLALAVIIIFALIGSLVVGLQATEDAKAQSIGSIIIDSDGLVIGTSSIQRNGDVYTLIGNLSAGIQIQRSNIIIDGAGYTIQGTSEYEIGIDLSNDDVGQDSSRYLISNVTIKNLKIINCYFAIDCSNTNNNTFVDNYIENCDTGFWIIGSSNNTLMYNTVKDCVTGISINYSGFNIITENNIINNSLLVWLSTEPFVDMNYWSDYLTKYPNAKEIEKSGLPNLLWDTPYNYGGSLGNFTDNHPLINPITITASPTSTTTPTTSRTPSTTPIITPTSPPTHQPTPSIEPTATVPEFPAWVVLPLAMITILLTIIIIRRKVDKTTLMSFPTARCTPFFISR
jgi:parallel beta-helix repeat protein